MLRVPIGKGADAEAYEYAGLVMKNYKTVPTQMPILVRIALLMSEGRELRLITGFSLCGFFIFQGEKTMYIGGLTPKQLKEQFSTPLYIFDESKIRNQCQKFRDSFYHPMMKTQVIYASKAFLTIAMAKLINEEGFYLDCVSSGEVFTVIKAGVPASKIVLHGNNKTIDELKDALQIGIGTIVVDNEKEAKDLISLVSERHQVNVFLRVNPGIDAHTHEYIKTSTHDSKFGMSIHDPRTFETLKLLSSTKYIHLLGTHSHIGSQILESQSFYEHAETIMKFYQEVLEKTQISMHEVNLGGGFGIKYLPNDYELDLSVTLPTMLEKLYKESKRLKLDIKKVYIEPGRSIIGEAGYTLYTINQIKTTINQKNYIFIDGAMNDHMRTALYQAKYDAIICGKEDQLQTKTYTIAGKACESGDIIIHSIQLPEAEENDLLLVKSTGAYHYSMASHYNRLNVPPVVFVKDGKARYVVKKESLMDLISHDVRGDQ